jgi:glucokinase
MILAGDIGGTNARLAYFQPQNGHLRLVSERVFPQPRAQRTRRDRHRVCWLFQHTPDAACFGIAGPVRNGRVETSNLPWVIEQSRLAQQIHLPATLLINDLEASAWGIGALENRSGSVESRERPRSRQSGRHRAGTGLGEAGFSGMEVAITFSPAKAATPISLRKAICRSSYCVSCEARFGHVSYERILSGPGLVNVYEFLRDAGCGKESDEFAVLLSNSDPAAAISRAALDGTEPLAEKASGILDRRLWRRGFQSGPENHGDRWNFPGRRHLAQNPAQVDQFRIHGGIPR